MTTGDGVVLGAPRRWLRTMIRTVRDGLARWNFDVLKNPMIASACLTDFLSR